MECVGMGVGVSVSEEEVWQALELLTGTVPMLAPAVAMAGGLAVLEVVKEVVMVDVSQHRCTWGNVAVGGAQAKSAETRTGQRQLQMGQGVMLVQVQVCGR